jgi:hypothetical protein
VRQECVGAINISGLSGAERKMRRIAEGIDQRVDLGA